MRRLILLSLFLLAACAPQPAPTPFRPPTSAAPTGPLPTLTPLPPVYAPPPTATFTPSPEGPCLNDLQFISDLTIPDGSLVFAGSTLDKRWLAQNSGSCHWDASYRLKWIGGDPLGAQESQPLYPARAGTQAVLQILFTAPQTPGEYESSWQAADAEGVLFGDPIYIKVIVQ